MLPEAKPTPCGRYSHQNMDDSQEIKGVRLNPRHTCERPGQSAGKEKRRRYSEHRFVAEAINKRAPQPQCSDVAKLACYCKRENCSDRIVQRPQHVNREKRCRQIGRKIPRSRNRMSRLKFFSRSGANSSASAGPAFSAGAIGLSGVMRKRYTPI